MKPVVIALCLLSLTPCRVFAGLPEAAPAEVGLDPSRLSRIDSAIQRAIDSGKIPGAVVVVARHGRVAYVQAIGKRAVQPEAEPMTRNTVFDLASLTKPIATAMSVMVLIDHGKLDPNDTLAVRLPKFDNHGKGPITMEQLLRHRAGFVPDNALSDYEGGPEAAWRSLAGLGLTRPPGERFVYSDVGFMVLGRLVDRVSGQTLDSFAKTNIFEPIGMTSTGFRPIGAVGLAPSESIAPTEKDEQGQWLRGVVHDPRARKLGGVAGHAGLFGTADDLAVLAQTILNGGIAPNGQRILKSETVWRMLDPGDTPPTQRRGLGWDLDTLYNCPRGRFGPRSFGHTGFTGTSLWIDPDTETIVVLLACRIHPADKGASINALRAEVSMLVGEAIVEPPFPPAPAGTAQVKCGVDVLIENGFDVLKGKRIGLVTNHTGRARDGRSTIDVLAHAPGVTLVKLFSPEHGIRGQVDREVSDSRDEATGLPIISLYGKTRKPTPESLEGLDVIVYDIQDIGARFYTYISTLGLTMEAARATGLPVVVLDRPNPIGGLAIGGPLREEAFASFIAYHDLPLRHGMTVGELAKMFNVEKSIGADLTVVPCDGWHRDDLFDRTGLLWVNPSPNMRSLTEALLYPGVGLMEATNLATGRGTDTPFERVGAPYVDPIRFAAALNDLGLSGVRFVPIRFTPAERQFAGQDCGGVFIQMTDRGEFDPIDLGLGMASTLLQLYPKDWQPSGLQAMLGSQAIYDALLAGQSPRELRSRCRADEQAFRTRRCAFLIYTR